MALKLVKKSPLLKKCCIAVFQHKLQETVKRWGQKEKCQTCIPIKNTIHFISVFQLPSQIRKTWNGIESMKERSSCSLNSSTALLRQRCSFTSSEIVCDCFSHLTPCYWSNKFSLGVRDCLYSTQFLTWCFFMIHFKMFSFIIESSFSGPAKKARPPDEVSWLTAYHEAGHTIVAYFTQEATPLHKVTIMHRGLSLGHVRNFCF